ncbi:MAG: ketoacyl-ACP synthase III [Deltaproteobacteria bacterium]|jgi:3-oxoacyl-[acyl-carrier-protein] synthase-3|nr:ketoacyl-ACP synthase III [Deltaproteobacteria bacterium]
MTKARFTKMKISGLSVVVPDYPQSIDDHIDYFDHDPAKLARAKKIVGYGTRYTSPPGCTPTDLCLAAGRRLIGDMKIDLDEIDALICVMQKPDFSQPGSSFIIHKYFQLPKTCACLDLNQGCPGFVYGLWLAGSLLESGSCRKILLFTGDYYDSSPKLRNRLLFGDAAAAMLVEYDKEPKPSYFNLGADGSSYDLIINPSSGARLPIRQDLLDLVVSDRQGDELKLIDGYLDGLEVFNFSIREVPPNVTELFEYAGLIASDIDFAAFHQANKQIVNHIATKSGLRKDQYSVLTFSEYGNQSSASVPGVLAHMLKERAATGQLKVLLCGYGIGAAWASCITELAHIYCSGIIKEKFDNMRTREEEISFWIKRISGANNDPS